MPVFSEYPQVMINPGELPPQAQVVLAQIEEHLREAQPMLNSSNGDADVFALRETQHRYLPETLKAFLLIPPSQRDVLNDAGESAQTQLLATLTTLERATRVHLGGATVAYRNALSINKRFTEERFAGIAPETDQCLFTQKSNLEQINTQATSAYVVHALFDAVSCEGTPDPRLLLEAMATRLLEAFPKLTKVSRQFFSRAVQSVEIAVPIPNGALRYAAIESQARLTTTVSRLIRGITLKTEVLQPDLWMQALTEHLMEFTQTSREDRQRLERIFQSNDSH